ncbi:uncharacterized protein PG998_014868 [Apiospora kogelbergensis]|uniref:uncharacterized protein n=1 Tax=Apiospora kogelbergensis TaxID=1337665 RepID=UPI0031319D5C
MSDEITNSTRFSPITETDNAGYVWIVTIIGIIYTAMICVLRGWIKFRVYGWDDALIAIATVLHLLQAIPVFWGLSSGLAKSNAITDPTNGPAISQSFFAAQLLGFVVLGLSKCSVLALMLRVFSPGTGTAGGYLQPHVGATIPDIITDVLICVVPIWVTAPLKLTKGVRFTVALGFSFRLLIVPLAVLRLSTFRAAAASADAQLAVADSLVLQQAALVVSLTSASIPNLRTFMRSIDCGFALPAPSRAGDTRASLASSSSHNRNSGRELSLRPDDVHHQARVSHGGTHLGDATLEEEQNSLNRSSSQERIITKRVEWDVRHDAG